MRWQGNRQSRNVEDRRASGGVGGRSIGIGSVVIALIAGWIFGVNPLTVLGLMQGTLNTAVTQQAPGRTGALEDQHGRFVATILADTEDVWKSLYANYREPRLVLFRDATQTGCGLGQSATGPFYCPADTTVYIDLRFFDELSRMGAPGEFAQAYVIAHEVGHHVQVLDGTMQQYESMRNRVSQTQFNQLTVRLELQADCYAGVWAHHSNRQRQTLEAGDVEAGLNAAAAVGDDTPQRAAGRSVQPDSFTHGSSAQRQRWFGTGLQSGDPNACNTFRATSL